MNPRPRKLLGLVHPQGIPWPASALYSALTRTSVFQRHYEMVAKDIVSYCPSGSVLDIGTGPAWLLVRLHEQCPALALAGVDISNAMVSKAKANLHSAGLADVIEVRQAGADRLPFDDCSFEVVVSTGSIHHWRDPVAGLNEAYRVLKPGGHALMYDLVTRLPEPIARDAARQYGRFRMMLLWLHSFEEPFYNAEELQSLAGLTRFATGQTQFVGVLCCLVLRRE